MAMFPRRIVVGSHQGKPGGGLTGGSGGGGGGGGFGGGGVAGPPVINGTPQFAATSPNVPTIPSANAGDMVIVYISHVGQVVTGMSSPNLPSGVWTRYARNLKLGDTGASEFWYAFAPHSLVNETITPAGGGTFYNMLAFVVSNVNNAYPFDPSYYAWYPAMMGLNPQDMAIPYTIRANTMVISGTRYSSTTNPTSGAGWTQLIPIGSGQSILVQQKTFTSPQAASSVILTGTGVNDINDGLFMIVTSDSNDPAEVPIHGGPTYFNDKGLTKAVAAGFDSPSFFQISSFLADIETAPNATAFKNLGWNIMYGRTGNDTDASAGTTSLSFIRGQGGIYVFENFQGNWVGFDNTGSATYTVPTPPTNQTFQVPSHPLTSTIGPDVGTNIGAAFVSAGIVVASMSGTVVSYTINGGGAGIDTLVIHVTATTGSGSHTGLWWFGNPYTDGWILNGNAMSSQIGSETVALMYQDEFAGVDEFGVTLAWTNAVDRRVANMPNTYSDGRAFILQFDDNYGSRKVGSNLDAYFQLQATQATPNTTVRSEVDIFTIDQYFITLGKQSNFMGAGIYGEEANAGGGTLTQDQYTRGSNYGDTIDQLANLRCGRPGPVGVAIETGDAKTNATLVSQLITPPEYNWVVWSTIIHGARHLLNFDHNNGPSPYGGNDCLITNSNFASPLPGQTVSMVSQVTTTCNMVITYAPIINSPIVAQYCRASPVGYVAPTPFIKLTNGIDVCVKHYTGGGSFTNGYYMFVTTRGGETSWVSTLATFTLNFLASASSATCLYDSEGVDTGTTFPITSRQFTHTFPHPWTVRIYRFNP
jgi:hypothetical protein